MFTYDDSSEYTIASWEGERASVVKKKENFNRKKKRDHIKKIKISRNNLKKGALCTLSSFK